GLRQPVVDAPQQEDARVVHARVAVLLRRGEPGAPCGAVALPARQVGAERGLPPPPAPLQQGAGLRRALAQPADDDMEVLRPLPMDDPPLPPVEEGPERVLQL